MPLLPSVQQFLARSASREMLRLCDLDLREARARFAYYAPLCSIRARKLALVEDVAFKARDGAPLNARVYYPEPPSWASPLPALLYFHAGGYVVGGLDTADALCRMLAADAACAVVSASYRLAPEHRFPCAVNDAIDTLHWLRLEAAGLAIDSTRLAVGGESSGATLAAVCAVEARDAGIPLKLQLLIYPALSAALDTDAHRRYGDGYHLSLDIIRWIQRLYLSEASDRADWRFAPLDGTRNAPDTWRELAPAWIASAEFDPLRDEHASYAAKLLAHGNTATLHVYPGMIHGFFSMGGIFPEAHAAHRDCAATLHAALYPEGA
jgi:acetyl esterase